MIVLVLNCGSSSLKYQLLNMSGENDYTVLASGLVDRIGQETADIKHKGLDGESIKLSKHIPNHNDGITDVLNLMLDPEKGVIKSLTDIGAVGHRVAHGGEIFKKSCRITPEVIADIEKLSVLAPLHNPANLLGIRAIEEVLPGIPQVAVFDTSFHLTSPDYAYMYGIPYEYYEKYGVRRYGFHGTSHKFVAKKACDLVGLDFNTAKVITCHLGNGSSVTAIKNGESLETSMGFTPLDGILMGTRAGNLDVGAALYIQEKEGLSAKEMNDVLNKKSGFLGVSGISSDCRDVEIQAYESNHERAYLSLKMFWHSIRRHVGSYLAVLGGVDLIVFTGGIGENDDNTRREVCSTLGFLGCEVDPNKNNGVRGKDKIISTDDSKVKVATVTTNEELVIAKDTMSLV